MGAASGFQLTSGCAVRSVFTAGKVFERGICIPMAPDFSSSVVVVVCLSDGGGARLFRLSRLPRRALQHSSGTREKIIHEPVV